MAIKTINVKELVADLRGGMNNAAVSEKYQITEKELAQVLKALLDGPVEALWKCSECGRLQLKVVDKCPECGHQKSDFDQEPEHAQIGATEDQQPMPDWISSDIRGTKVRSSLPVEKIIWGAAAVILIVIGILVVSLLTKSNTQVEETRIYAPMRQVIVRFMKQLEIGITFFQHQEASQEFVKGVADLELNLRGNNPELMNKLNEAARILKLAESEWLRAIRSEYGSGSSSTELQDHWKNFSLVCSDALLIMKDPQEYRKRQEQVRAAERRQAEAIRKKNEEELKRKEAQKQWELEQARKAEEENREKCRKETLLVTASAKGDLQTVRSLLSKGVDVQAGSGQSGGKIPLLAASENGHLETVKLLLASGAKINALDKHDDSALLLAYRGGHLDTVRALLTHGADVARVAGLASAKGDLAVLEILLNESVLGRDPLLIQELFREGIRTGNLNVVVFLLRYGPNINEVISGYESALVFAYERKNLELMKILLTAGFQIAPQIMDRTLLSATRDANSDAVSLLLEHGADINVRDGARTLPIITIIRGHQNLLELLLEKGADFANIETSNATLAMAYDKKKTDMLRAILTKGTNLPIESKNYLLTRAISDRNHEYAELILQYGGDPKITDTSGNPLIMQAFFKGDKAMVQLLVKRGGEIDCRDRRGDTLLIRVAAEGKRDLLSELVKMGADVNAVNQDGESALMAACNLGKSSIAELLLEKGADVNCADKRGVTPLIRAADGGHVEAVKLLLQKGANVHAKAANGRTAIMKPASEGLLEIIDLLLQKGVDPNIKDNNGETALMYACSKSKVKAINLLLEKGADPKMKDNDGNTALMYACQKGSVEVASTLLRRGADINDRNRDGVTALMLACAHRKVDMVKLLLATGADVRAVDRKGEPAHAKVEGSDSESSEIRKLLHSEENKKRQK
jgi:ankyrin repeat protein